MHLEFQMFGIYHEITFNIKSLGPEWRQLTWKTAISKYRYSENPY
jgi:hypothetical protein